MTSPPDLRELLDAIVRRLREPPDHGGVDCGTDLTDLGQSVTAELERVFDAHIESTEPNAA